MANADKQRMSLYRLMKNDPTLVPSMLDAIRSQALTALRAVLDTAEPRVLAEMEKRVEAVFTRLKKAAEQMHEEAAEKFLSKLDKKIEAEVAKVRLIKGEKGDTPSVEMLIALIKPMIPKVQDGKTPTRDELVEIMSPIMAQLIAQAIPSPSTVAEQQQEFDKKLDAAIEKGIANKLSEIKRFGGGGGTGPNPTPVNGITTGGGIGKELTGSVNGSNTQFTLPRTPKVGTERVYLNGIRMRSGASNDYTITGKVITFNTAPLSGDIIVVDIDAGY